MHIIAIYSLNINIVSRGKGKSAVCAAAYRAGELIKNEYDGQVHDYTRKKGIAYCDILLPQNAPAEYANRSILWNAVEKAEKAKNAQLAREVRLVLPVEFNIEQNINLVHEYVKHNFVDKGMCADICIHDKGDGNPHAHVLLTMRPLEQDGSWGAKSKMEYILDDTGERIKLPSGRYKTKKITATGWDERSNAEEWRAAWADIVNRYLENGGHETRVDHRSYERQGVEQIPTIHLGAVAHGLEKRGIVTERGDINRKIEKANARIKAIDNDIQKIKNPPRPQMIIDLEKSIKAQDSPGYANWCRIFNLKQAAYTLLYMKEHGFTDMESLQTARQQAQTVCTDIQKQINDVSAKVKALKTKKTQTEEYRNTLDIYKKYTAPGQFNRFKNDYYNRHKEEIEKHKKARAYIFEELKLDKLPYLKELSGEINKLTEKEKSLRQDLKTARQKATALTNAEHNTRMLLGYSELESKGYSPTTPTNGLRFIMPYESSFEVAYKTSKAEEYFQSCLMDYDCAYDIHRVIFDCIDKEEAAEKILMKYSKERAEGVMAAIISNAPVDMYTDHKEWASQKRNNQNLEPSARNIEVFQRPSGNAKAFDLFIQKFRDVADSMVSAIFPFKDDVIIGWAFPKEMAKPKTEDRNWDNMSIAERLAMGKQKAKEQEQAHSQSVRSSRSTRKRNDAEL